MFILASENVFCKMVAIFAWPQCVDCIREAPKVAELDCVFHNIDSCSAECKLYAYIWLCFYQTRPAWSMDQGSNTNHSPINNFTPTVTKFCVMWEGQALPHDTKFRNCRSKIVDSRMFPSWSLIHGSSWSGLIKAEHEDNMSPSGHPCDSTICRDAAVMLPVIGMGIIYLTHEYQTVNTLRPRQDGHHFPDDIFKYIFLNENVWIPNKVSLKFIPKGPINNNPALVQVMAWRRPGDKPLSEPMMVRLPTHICVTRPQWVNWYGKNMYDLWIFCLFNSANFVSRNYQSQ